MKRDQLPGERRQLVNLPACVATLDNEVLALDVAAFAQFLVERHVNRRAEVGRRHVQHADPIHLGRRLRRCVERQQKKAASNGEQNSQYPTLHRDVFGRCITGSPRSRWERDRCDAAIDG
jgi:hypothetical protein